MKTTAAKHRMWDNANKIGKIQDLATLIFTSQAAYITYAIASLLTAAWMEQHI